MHGVGIGGGRWPGILGLAAGLWLAFTALGPAAQPPETAGKGQENPAQVLTNTQREVTIRKQALRALAQTKAGAELVLSLAKADLLPNDLRLAACMELNRAGWQEVRQQAAEILPLPQGPDGTPVPSLEELVKRQGNAANGEKVFSKPEVNCIGCHVLRDQGTVVGPDLSDIGNKLTKEALYESILDPNAGITAGFETWQVILKSEDEAYGLLSGETAEEVAIKDLKGNVTRFKKSDIKTREQLRISIMPADLQKAMTLQELADVVEFLATLKKPVSAK